MIARCTREIHSSTAHGKSSIQQQEDSFHEQTGLWSIALYGAETWTLGK
jgi:hypothetical protein